jgi:hypothetical protein
MLTNSEKQALVMVRLFRDKANVHYTTRRNLVRTKYMSSNMVLTPMGEVAAREILQAMGLEVTVI